MGAGHCSEQSNVGAGDDTQVSWGHAGALTCLTIYLSMPKFFRSESAPRHGYNPSTEKTKQRRWRV